MSYRSGSLYLAGAIAFSLAAACSTNDGLSLRGKGGGSRGVDEVPSGDGPGGTSPSESGTGAGSPGTPNAPAPDAPQTYAPLTEPWSLELVNTLVQRDKAKRGADAAYYKYTYIPQSFLGKKEDTNYARIGITKALNSVAIDADDIAPLEDVGGYGLVFAFDVRKYLKGDVALKWGWVAKGEPIDLGGGGHQDLAAPMRLRPFDADAPVAADRLAYNLLHGGIYTAIVDTPLRRTEFEAQLGVGARTAKLGFEHGITYGIRYAERKTFKLTYKDGHTKEGCYWITFDPFDPKSGGDTSLVWKEGGGRAASFNYLGQIADYKSNVAAESYFSMKNGLFAWFVWGEGDQRRSRADPRFVIDPLQRDDANQPQDVTTGFCANCHVRGIQGAFSAMGEAATRGTITNSEATQFWTPNGELMGYFEKDRAAFKDAMRKIVTFVSDAPASFNAGIIEGSDPKEPMYYLARDIGKHSGDTSGLRRRRDDGVVPALSGDTPIAAAPSTKSALTFAGDVLPILSSASGTKKYACTTCHAGFASEALLDRATLDLVLANVKWRYMPVGASTDKVSPEDIGILEAWKKQAFPE